MQADVAQERTAKLELVAQLRVAQEAVKDKTFEAERWRYRATTKPLSKMSVHCVLSVSVDCGS